MYSKEEIEKKRNKRFAVSFKLYDAEDIVKAAEIINTSSERDYDTCSDYDSGYTEFTFFRAQTDEEVIEDLNRDKILNERTLEYQRKQYEELKKIFEPK